MPPVKYWGPGPILFGSGLARSFRLRPLKLLIFLLFLETCMAAPKVSPTFETTITSQPTPAQSNKETDIAEAETLSKVEGANASGQMHAGFEAKTHNIRDRLSPHLFFEGPMKIRCASPEKVLRDGIRPHFRHKQRDPWWSWLIDPSTSDEYKRVRIEHLSADCPHCTCNEKTGQMGVGSFPSPCKTKDIVELCQELFRCFCNVTLREPSVEVFSRLPQRFQNLESLTDAYRRIPLAIRRNNRGFTWNHDIMRQYLGHPPGEASGTVPAEELAEALFHVVQEQPPGPPSGREPGDWPSPDLDPIDLDLGMGLEPEFPPFEHVTGWEFIYGGKTPRFL
ncbi:hypothetical protein TWF481_004923 [Arthrobotrys musiformis]|uniref:Uncharacterized protein n=1 Tax=Arthrobotrys musiformis TaxID=47236 RepID=A0AAV9WKY6_9PEZI